MDCSPPGSSVHEILQARTLEWAATSSSGDLPDPGIEFPSPALEKEMATHSSVLAWRISWTGEPGGLQFMGSQRVRHDLSDLAHSITCKVTKFSNLVL